MKEKKEVEIIEELARQVGREAETAFQLRDACRLRYLRERLKINSLKISLWQGLLEPWGERQEVAKAKGAISTLEAIARRIDTLLEILGAGEKQEG